MSNKLEHKRQTLLILLCRALLVVEGQMNCWVDGRKHECKGVKLILPGTNEVELSK